MNGPRTRLWICFIYTLRYPCLPHLLLLCFFVLCLPLLPPPLSLHLPTVCPPHTRVLSTYQRHREWSSLWNFTGTGMKSVFVVCPCIWTVFLLLFFFPEEVVLFVVAQSVKVYKKAFSDGAGCDRPPQTTHHLQLVGYIPHWQAVTLGQTDGITGRERGREGEKEWQTRFERL